MSIVVTGATGHLGRLVVESLLAQGVPAADITAAGRRTDTIADLADRGVRVSPIDYADPASLRAAFAGAGKVLLVSGSEMGQRVAQHRNVIAAARTADVGFLAYTSILRADTSTLRLAEEHAATEVAIRASGLPYAFLRNSWYLENYTEQLATTMDNGALLGAGGAGRVSAATRADYAAAAAVVLAGEGHDGAVYELGGDGAFTLAELADEIARQSGKDIVYRDLPVDDYAQALIGFGVPGPFAELLADSDRGVANGDLFADTRDLSRLIGRPTTSLAEAISAGLTRIQSLTP